MAWSEWCQWTRNSPGAFLAVSSNRPGRRCRPETGLPAKVGVTQGVCPKPRGPGPSIQSRMPSLSSTFRYPSQVHSLCEVLSSHCVRCCSQRVSRFSAVSVSQTHCSLLPVPNFSRQRRRKFPRYIHRQLSLRTTSSLHQACLPTQTKYLLQPGLPSRQRLFSTGCLSLSSDLLPPISPLIKTVRPCNYQIRTHATQYWNMGISLENHNTWHVLSHFSLQTEFSIDGQYTSKSKLLVIIEGHIVTRRHLFSCDQVRAVVCACTSAERHSLLSGLLPLPQRIRHHFKASGQWRPTSPRNALDLTHWCILIWMHLPCMQHIKAILTTDSLILLDSEHPAIQQFIPELQVSSEWLIDVGWLNTRTNALVSCLISSPEKAGCDGWWSFTVRT